MQPHPDTQIQQACPCDGLSKAKITPVCISALGRKGTISMHWRGTLPPLFLPCITIHERCIFAPASKYLKRSTATTQYLQRFQRSIPKIVILGIVPLKTPEFVEIQPFLHVCNSALSLAKRRIQDTHTSVSLLAFYLAPMGRYVPAVEVSAKCSRYTHRSMLSYLPCTQWRYLPCVFMYTQWADIQRASHPGGNTAILVYSILVYSGLFYSYPFVIKWYQMLSNDIKCYLQAWKKRHRECPSSLIFQCLQVLQLTCLP